MIKINTKLFLFHMWKIKAEDFYTLKGVYFKILEIRMERETYRKIYPKTFITCEIAVTDLMVVKF